MVFHFTTAKAPPPKNLAPGPPMYQSGMRKGQPSKKLFISPQKILSFAHQWRKGDTGCQ